MNKKPSKLVVKTVPTEELGEGLKNLDEIWSDFGKELKELDRWVITQLEQIPNIKYLRGEQYPYANYAAIETLLWKYGKKYIEELAKKCPVKKRRHKEDVFESVAWVIFIKKIDPRSIMVIPEYTSLWDRISEKGNA